MRCLRLILIVIACLVGALFALSIKWDLNNDLKVNLQDLGLLNAKLGITSGSPGWDVRYDIDGNGVIDSLDGMEIMKQLHFTDDMALVPAGKFIMGQKGLFDEMQDTIHVYLDSFLIDEHEITNQQFVLFLNSGQDSLFYRGADSMFQDIDSSGGRFFVKSGMDRYPVRNISWRAANQYCASNKKRLPTSAEWEKAARGTDGNLNSWGNGFADSNCANYNYYCDSLYLTQFPDSLRQMKCIEFTKTINSKPIGSFEKDKSVYGVYDLSGNVEEWTNDWSAVIPIYYYWKLPDARSNPQGAPKPPGGSKVARGGSYLSPGRGLIVPIAIEDGVLPASNKGFRCAY